MVRESAQMLDEQLCGYQERWLCPVLCNLVRRIGYSSCLPPWLQNQGGLCGYDDHPVASRAIVRVAGEGPSA